MAEYTPIAINAMSFTVSTGTYTSEVHYCRHARIDSLHHLHLTCAEPDAGLTYTLRCVLGDLNVVIAENKSADRKSLNGDIWRPSSADDEIAALLNGQDYCLGTFYCDTYKGAELVGTTSMNFTLIGAVLSGIEGASSSFGGTMHPISGFIVGTASTLYFQAKLDGARHDVSYKMGEYTGEIGTNAEGSITWTPPYELANCLPDSTNGTLEITVKTKSGMYGTIGEAVFLYTVTVPQNADTKPNITAEAMPVGNLRSVFDGLFIRGLTGVQTKMTAEARYGAVITSQRIYFEGNILEGSSGLFPTISGTGSINVTFSATDSRGFTASVVQTITVIPYDKPRVVPADGENKIVCARCTGDGTISKKGEFLLIKAGRKYSFIESKNHCALHYRCKLATATWDSDWVPLLNEDSENEEVSMIVDGIVLSIKSAYTVQIGVEDSVGNYHVITIPIGSAIVPWHLGENGRNAAVGQYCDYSRADAFDIAFTTWFNAGAAAQLVFEDGSWAAGSELTEAVADADLTGIGTYNLLIAVSGGIPVLLVKAGSAIAGGGIRIEYAMVDGVEQLTLQTAESPITALYKLL